MIKNFPRLEFLFVEGHSYFSVTQWIHHFPSERRMPYFILGNNIPEPVLLTESKAAKEVTARVHGANNIVTSSETFISLCVEME